MSSSSSLLLTAIANIKAKLGVNALEGDKPVPENVKASYINFKNFLVGATEDEATAPLVPSELASIVDKAWDRSNKGKKLYNVTDLCWCLMNSADSSMLTERKDQNNNNGKSTTTSAPVVSRQDIESTSLIQFYKNLLLQNNNNIFDASEWSAFLDSLCSPLPMTFRLHQQGSYKSECAQIMLQKDEGLQKIIRPVLPNENGTAGIPAFGCSNETYRESHREQDLCRTCHSGGLWSFQEFVSMLPVASLQIQPHHKVFDLCAAPGSKSLQALDALNGQRNLQTSSSVSSFSSNFLKNGGGCLVCNEKQPTKARQILPARMKRYGALQNVVLCSDATKLPWFVQAHHFGNNNNNDDAKDPRFYFDRVICDVPCCGDGTVRKDRSVFGTWNIDYVNQLSDIQLRIARRAVGMLNVGGRMAYSTCSLNPIEDEHVVFHLMCLMNNNQSKGSAQEGREQIELLDVNEILKNECGVNLKSSGGIDLGKLSSSETQQQDDDANSNNNNNQFWSLEKLLEKIPETFRPSLEDAKTLCSEIAKKVLRVYPHRDNTGGFFVALIGKKENVPNTLPKANKFQILSNRKRFELVHPNDDEWKRTMEFFGLEHRWKAVFPHVDLVKDESTFLSQPHVQLFSAPPSSPSDDEPKYSEEPLIPFWCLGINNPQQKRRIHLTTLSAAALVFNSQLAGGNLELVNFGVRLFERMPENYLNLTVPQRLRIVSEAADLIQPQKRVWVLNNTFNAEANGNEFIKNILYRGYAQVALPSANTNSNSNVQEDQDHSSSNNNEPLQLSPALVHNGQHVPGSFVFCINFTPTCQVWLAAMLTPLGKVDLLADGSVRRMLLQVFYGVSLESNRVESGARRQRNNNANGDENEEDGEENDEQGCCDGEEEF